MRLWIYSVLHVCLQLILTDCMKKKPNNQLLNLFYWLWYGDMLHAYFLAHIKVEKCRAIRPIIFIAITTNTYTHNIFFNRILVFQITNTPIVFNMIFILNPINRSTRKSATSTCFHFFPFFIPLLVLTCKVRVNSFWLLVTIYHASNPNRNQKYV